MKLIVKEYLASLREREELDAILPDLLSQLGLNVFSRPGRGTRQDGVDVAAVGSLAGEAETVYLFTIKGGDITRTNWDSAGPQSLRPTLNEILDAYIANRLPVEHRGKPIVVCICCGGDVQEQVRAQLEAYISQNTRSNLSFQQWNGDKLADLIQANFLREDLLPDTSKSLLRKALALLDEPETSYAHFAGLIRALSSVDTTKDKEALTALRQMCLCLWVLYAWCRKAGNVEAAYRASEFAALHAWHITRAFAARQDKAAVAIQSAFAATLSCYQQVCTYYIEKVVVPHANKLHGLSSGVRSSTGLDVNLKLFDVLGRVALDGIWSLWGAHRAQGDAQEVQRCMDLAASRAETLIAMIASNPTLLMPVKDDQAIDITLALFLITAATPELPQVQRWLGEMFGRATFAFETFGDYPSTISSYSELLERQRDAAYREEATSGSLLYPVIALWAALCNFDRLYEKVGKFKNEKLQHCNFQYWYPDAQSEAHIYTNSDGHGSTLSHLPVDRPKADFLDAMFAECTQSAHYEKLSAVVYDLFPIILMACRHYRLPIPLHLFTGFRDSAPAAQDATAPQPEVSPA